MVEPLGRCVGCAEPSSARSGAHRPAARAHPRSGSSASAHADACASSSPRAAAHPGAAARRVAGARACPGTRARSRPASAQRWRLWASARPEAHPRPYAARTAPQRAASAVPCPAASGTIARTSGAHPGPRAELRAAARGGARGLAVGTARGRHRRRGRVRCRLPPLAAWVTGQSAFEAIRASISAHPASTSGPIKRRAISASSADTAPAASRCTTTPPPPRP